MDKLTATERAVHATLDRLTEGAAALGLAVSGGSDSMALLELAHRWAGARRLEVVTLDHGLRPEARDEAREVARRCDALGRQHEILCWQHGAEAGGNLMARAREARLELITDWAIARGLGAVAQGHTRDDVAETLLMRLMRGAGLDGLSEMAERQCHRGIIWLRPLLDHDREALRDYLRGCGVSWAEDPSNDDQARLRAATRAQMRALGLGSAGLARSARALAMAREALDHTAWHIAREARLAHGDVELPAQWAAAPPEIRRRLVLAARAHVTGAAHPPRQSEVAAALSQLARGKAATLGGAMLVPRAAGQLAVFREPRAAACAAAAFGSGAAVWDGRWQISRIESGQHVAALGMAGFAALRAAGRARPEGLGMQQCLGLPALWRGEELVAAALFDPPSDMPATALRGEKDWQDRFILH